MLYPIPASPQEIVAFHQKPVDEEMVAAAIAGVIRIVSAKGQSLEQLTADNVEHIAMGNPDTTPNARYARAALQKEGLWEKVEPKLVLASNVRQSLSYVSRGEVEAGFVFSTDAKQDEDKVNVALVIPTVAAGEKAGEWVPNPIVYPIAETTQTKSKVSADFVAYVLSDEGQAILAKYGFIPIKDMDK